MFDETNSFYDANRLIHIVHVICVNQQMYFYIHSLKLQASVPLKEKFLSYFAH